MSGHKPNADVAAAITAATLTEPQSKSATAIRTLAATIRVLMVYPDDLCALRAAAAAESIMYNLGANTVKDAALIAAAPDMLAALRHLVNTHTGATWQTAAAQREAWLEAAAAIARATGTSA